MATNFFSAPPADVLEQFESSSVQVVRWVDIYEADNVTLWRSFSDFTGGEVTVDSTRDERRNIDITFANDDGGVPYGPGNLWYDKIIKPYRGVVMPPTTTDSYLNLPGVIGNHLVVSRSALSDVTLLQFAVRVTFNSLGVLQILCGWGSANATLRVDADNKLYIAALTAASAVLGGAASSAALPFTADQVAAGTKFWVKGALRILDASCAYAYSYDDTNDFDQVVWTELGTPQTGTNAGAALLYTGSTSSLWGTNSVAAAGFTGKLHAGSETINTPSPENSTIKFSLAGQTAAASTVTALTGQTMTVATSGGSPALIFGAVVNASEVWATALGEFMIDTISRPRFPHEVKVTGRDFVKKLLLAKFANATAFAAGTNVAAVINAIATNGGITKFNFATPSNTLSVATTFDRGSPRWDAIKKLADSISHEVFFDGFGYLTLRPMVDPLTAPLLYTFKTGPAGNLVDFSRSTNDTRLYNDVCVYGDNPSAPLIFAQSENTAVSSPTRIAQLGRRTYTYASQFFTGTPQAQAFADSLLSVMALEQYDMELTSIVLPWLEASGAVEVLLPDAVVGDPTRFLLSAFSIPMALGSMSGSVKRITIVG